MATQQICNLAITTAVTGSIQTIYKGFSSPQALTIQAKFTYVASAATSVDAYVQTTIDGTVWIDIAEFRFTTSSSTVVVNLSGLSTVTTPAAITSGSMTANTTQQGVLGDQYRVVVTSVGTYGAGTTLAIDVAAR